MQWRLLARRHGGRSGGGVVSHQKLPLLLPVVSLRVGGHVGLRHHADEVPLLLRGLLAVQHRPLQLLLPTALAVLLDQLALG